MAEDPKRRFSWIKVVGIILVLAFGLLALVVFAVKRIVSLGERP